MPWSADGWLVAGGAIERLFSACWTRERVEPVSFLGRCSDLLSLLGIHLYVTEHGVNSPFVSNAPVAAGPSKGAKAPSIDRRRSPFRYTLGGALGRWATIQDC